MATFNPGKMGSCTIYVEVLLDDTNPTSLKTRPEMAQNDVKNSKSSAAQNNVKNSKSSVAQNNVSQRREARRWLWVGGTATGGMKKLRRSLAGCDNGRRCVSAGLGPSAARRERENGQERERTSERRE
ncbi:hypothetical protein PanWU01x14_136270 [Parasponia andersonii]|uniref:Uncharacterized protein n=1 Tax=Parasponia andersonii TaxID=3476 RepID=A0A2P5CNW8_PARAD|nr:hypothetical protein PanWU01x14_136270 [Parasponia andersonii]